MWKAPKGLTWDSRHLLFAVREPYAGTAGRTELVYGRLNARTPGAGVAHGGRRRRLQ
jgi:hypothetical protein